MAFTTTSANMLLPVPIVGQDPGPQYATDINSCLTIIDGHDHSAGHGVQITPNGLNITSALDFQDNNLIAVQSVRFQSQSALLSGALDIGCLYESGVDLYYNDGNGVNIPITANGGLAGTPGSITGLPSGTAAVTFVSGIPSYVFTSATVTPCDIDVGSVIFRNDTASSYGMTMAPPAAMANDRTITWPNLPAAQKFMTLDNSGNIAASWAVDASTIVVSSNVVKVPALGITSNELAANSVITTKITDGNVTAAKLASDSVTTAKILTANVTWAKRATRAPGTTGVAVGGVLKPATVAVSSSSTSPVAVLSGTLVCDGGPLLVHLLTQDLRVSFDGFNGYFATITLLIDGIATQAFDIGFTQGGGVLTNAFGASPTFYAVPSAGTRSIAITVQVSGAAVVSASAMTFVAYEI